MRTIEQEQLLDALPTGTLRYLAREYGVDGPDAATRGQLKSAVATAPSYSTETMLTLLRGEDLNRVARAAGMRPENMTGRQIKARLVGARARPGEGGGKTVEAPKPVGYLLDMTPVGRLFLERGGDVASRLYVGEAIPGRLLTNASAQMRIPDYEHIMVLYDNSLRGTCANGFAIGEHGIYWRNPFGLGPGRTAMNWHEFARSPLEAAGRYEVRLGNGAALHMTFFEARDLIACLGEVREYALTAASRRGMELVCPDMKTIVKRCRRYNPESFDSFSFGAHLDEATHGLMLRCFGMPDFERIAVLCDDTVLGSCRRGFVFGMHGLYWRNGLGTRSRRNALSWSEFAHADISEEDEDRIYLGEDALIHMEFLGGALGLRLFTELQGMVRVAAGEIARHTVLDKDAARMLRKELDEELQERETMAVAVARARHVSSMQHARAEALRVASGAVEGALTVVGRAGSGLLRKAGVRG